VENAAVLVHKAYKPTPPPRQSRAGVNRLSPLTQALDLKDQAYMDALSPETPVHVKAALMRAWVDLEEIRMALRGQGKPKPVEARNAKPKGKHPQSIAPIAPVIDVAPTPHPSLPANVTHPESV